MSRRITSVRLGLFVFVFSWSVVTLLTFLAQELGISFSLYARLTGTVFLLFCALFAWQFRALVAAATVDIPDFVVGQKWHLWVIGSIVLLYGFFCIILFNPNIDNYYYLSNAKYMLQNPSNAMGYEVRAILPLTTPFISGRWAVSGPYEYLSAALEYLTQIHFLTWIYTFWPFVQGCIAAIVLYYIIVLSTGKAEHAFWGFVIAAAIFLLIGDTPYGPLKYSFANSSVAKSGLLWYLIPLFATESLQFLRSPTRFTLFLLASITGAAAALTSSGIVLLLGAGVISILFVFITGSHLWHQKSTNVPSYRFAWGSTKILFGYLCSMVPLMLYGLWLSQPYLQNPSPTSIPNQFRDNQFWTHAQLFYNQSAPLTPALFGITILSFFLTLSFKISRVVLAYVGLVILLLLNPVVAPFLIDNVTGSDTYWRLFYFLCPIPLFGIAITQIISRYVPKNGALNRALGVFASIVYVYALLYMPQSLVNDKRFVNLSRIPVLGFEESFWEIPTTELLVAKQISAVVPAGRMLAPTSVSGTLAITDGRYTHLAFRSTVEATWGAFENNQKGMSRRSFSQRYLDDQGDVKFEVFANELKDEHGIIDILVLKSTVYERPNVRSLLDSYGFKWSGSSDPYIFLTKQE